MSRNGILLTYLLSSIASCDAFGFTPSPSLTTKVSNTLSSIHPLSPQHNNNRSNRRFVPFMAADSTDETNDEEEAEASSEDEKKEDEPPVSEKKASSDATDILNSPSFLQKKLEVLTKDVAVIEAKIEEANEVYKANKEEWGSQIDALNAEYSNINNRFKTMSAAETATATTEVARKVINVIDNFDRAFTSIQPETDDEQAVESAYKESYDLLLSILDNLGVKQMETVGKEFDFQFHQAIMSRPDEDFEEGIVCEEMQKGFAMEDGTLIRAAMVVVAA